MSPEIRRQINEAFVRGVLDEICVEVYEKVLSSLKICG
jgi:hypothetical protein